MPKENFDTYTAKDTVPASVTFTPTVTTSGKRYTLSAANTDLKRGDYLYDASQDETRMVDLVISSTEGRLSEAFSSNLSTTTVKRVVQPKLVKWGVSADNGGAVSVNGTNLPSGSSINFSASEYDQQTGAQFLAPPVVDGSTNDASVTWTNF